jgi:hypothetical protein
MHLVLYEEVDQRNECRKESTSQILPILYSLRIRRTQHNTPNGPRQRRNQITNHEYVMPIVIIRARNIRPPTTRQRPEDTNPRHEFRQSTVFPAAADAVPQEDQHEARAGADGDEDLEDGSFGVAVADGGADGGEPFGRVAVVFVLYDLGVVQPDADDEGAEEGEVGGDGVRVGDPVAGYLEEY